MPGFLLYGEEVKWAVVTIVIAISSLVIMMSINSFLLRDVSSDNVDFMLEKEYFKRNLVSNGVLVPEKLESLQTIGSTGVLMKVGIDEYYSNKARYDENVLCGRYDQYRCRNYKEVFLVDGKLELVQIEMVRKVE